MISQKTFFTTIFLIGFVFFCVYVLGNNQTPPSLYEVGPNTWVSAQNILVVREAVPYEIKDRGNGPWSTIIMANDYRFYIQGNPSDISKKINKEGSNRK